MEKIKAIPVCPDCNCVMFKKIYQSDIPMEGWSCPECFITRWDYDGQNNIGEPQ